MAKIINSYLGRFEIDSIHNASDNTRRLTEELFEQSKEKLKDPPDDLTLCKDVPWEFILDIVSESIPIGLIYNLYKEGVFRKRKYANVCISLELRNDKTLNLANCILPLWSEGDWFKTESASIRLTSDLNLYSTTYDMMTYYRLENHLQDVCNELQTAPHITIIHNGDMITNYHTK